jgi:aminoglycoside phosphotransferase (APT) family kinase protein/putative sterol carrier protein
MHMRSARGSDAAHGNVMLGRQRDLDRTRDRLVAWLRTRKPGVSDVDLARLTAPKAGVSNETFLADATWREDGGVRTQSLVIRLEPTDFLVFPEYDLGRQVGVLRALAPTGVPVPHVLWHEDDRAVLGCPFYVMERVVGEVPSEVPPYHAFGLCLDASPERRATMWWSGVEMLARIHALDWQALGLAFLGVPGGGTDPLDRQLAYWERYLRWASPEIAQPILDAALAWLRAERYEPERVALCWGDSRLPNVILRDDRVAAVLDWEMAFLGDPEADLGWWLFMDWASSEGYGFPRLAGFPGVDETIQRYEAWSGHAVRHARWQEVFAAFRFGAIMARVAARLRAIGAALPVPDFETNNVCTQRLATLLDLPAPGAPRTATAIESSTVRVQFRLTGPGGADWYVVSERGRATRHDGVVEGADVTVTATAPDWEALQRGELDRAEAFLGGRLRVEGDLSLLMQLEDAIARATPAAPCAPARG